MAIIIILISFVAILYLIDFSPKQTFWGVTFSEQYAKDELGLDWKAAYLAILDDLKVSHLRLSAYWNQNEPDQNKYRFGDLDWQIAEASKREVKIILAVGRKLPRWPECHDPGWTKSLTTNEVQKSQLDFIQATVNRYKDNPNLIAWQVENEPFLQLFGECPPLDKNFFEKEIELVRNLSDKPVMITDSGELNWWVNAAKMKPDIIGTTLYRVVYNPTIGYLRWPLPSSFYYLKSLTVRSLFGIKRVIVAELQAEAWHKAGTDLSKMTIDEQFESFDLKQFNKNIEFTKKAGFDEAYLWGAEWWYFLKEKKSYPAIWEEAKKLWQ